MSVVSGIFFPLWEKQMPLCCIGSRKSFRKQKMASVTRVWCISITSALRKQRQEFHEFKASLVYIAKPSHIN